MRSSRPAHAPVEQRAVVAVRAELAEGQLEPLGQLAEGLQLQRARGAAQAVRFERGVGYRRAAVRRRIARAELDEAALDARKTPWRVEQEDAEQLLQSAFLDPAQKIPWSCAAAIASARRETPSFA